jgi:REP element-mobilizing transposase RayT
MQLIKGRSSRKINEGHFWQKGFFDFTILTEEKFREKFNYIHYNPVKRGLVEKAEDYKYSSAMRYRTKYGEVFYNQ